ncbi:hypothetical protein BD779DRAFT_644190 [Infundibulicybe gibba]|nr:hypothetical protein BD779DRAFT_644190 [Infundibulicybe gibba]
MEWGQSTGQGQLRGRRRGCRPIIRWSQGDLGRGGIGSGVGVGGGVWYSNIGSRDNKERKKAIQPRKNLNTTNKPKPLNPSTSVDQNDARVKGPLELKRNINTRPRRPASSTTPHRRPPADHNTTPHTPRNIPEHGAFCLLWVNI